MGGGPGSEPESKQTEDQRKESQGEEDQGEEDHGEEGRNRRGRRCRDGGIGPARCQRAGAIMRPPLAKEDSYQNVNVDTAQVSVSP